MVHRAPQVVDAPHFDLLGVLDERFAFFGNAVNVDGQGFQGFAHMGEALLRIFHE